MDLPTYTSIWRIEKRLYKLYDFRLPMPLPIGQVTVFAAIAVPYVVLLTVLGLPFNHTLIWLYVLPPGLATWLVTRPVLESKRLPELIRSQLRYLSEPRILCRMAPLSERDVVVVTGRIWRPRPSRRQAGFLPNTDARDEMAADEPGNIAAEQPGRTRGRPRRGPLPPGRSRDLAPSPAARTASQEATPARAGAAAAGGEPGWASRPPMFAGSPAPGRLASDGPAWTAGAGEIAGAGAAAGRQPAGAGGAREVRRMSPAEFRLAASSRSALPRTPVRGDAGPSAPEGGRPPEDERPPRAEDAPMRVQSELPDHRPAPADRPRGEQVPRPAAQDSEPGPADRVAPDVAAGVLGAADVPERDDQIARPGIGVTPTTAESDGCHTDTGATSAAGAPDRPAAAGQVAAQGEPTAEGHPARAAAAPGEAAGAARPVVTVVGAGAAKTAAPAVERALAGPSARRGDLRAGRVAVVPGGHRPGKPDLLQRDRARAQQPIGIRPRIVVLGCTVGAGQTVTTLLTGEVLSSLRQDQVAVMDLNPGPGSLARRAEARPAPSQAALAGRSRLVVVGPRTAADGNQAAAMPRDPAIDAITFEAATDRYDLVLADPATVAVPRLLAVADQLVLVAPASAAAPGAIAMTIEWLEAHGQSALAAGSIMVLNGVSRRSSGSVEQAERVCAGRCRAIVRIPWDDQLQPQIPRRAAPAGPSAQLRQHWTGVLNAPTAAAYTALAGVLVASLAAQCDPGQAEDGHGREQEPVHAGQVRR